MNKRLALAAGALVIAGVAAPAYATTVNVGGGTWNYGVNYGIINKTTYSQYVHNSLYHSATSICGSNNQKVFANATYWANSSAGCGITSNTAAYWATY